MDLGSILALTGTLVAVAGVYVPARFQIKANKLARVEQLKRDRDAELEKAVTPYKERIAELQRAEQEMVDNAVELWRAQAGQLERDRDYWRARAEGPPVVVLEKRPRAATDDE